MWFPNGYSSPWAASLNPLYSTQVANPFVSSFAPQIPYAPQFVPQVSPWDIFASYSMASLGMMAGYGIGSMMLGGMGMGMYGMGMWGAGLGLGFGSWGWGGMPFGSGLWSPFPTFDNWNGGFNWPGPF